MSALDATDRQLIMDAVGESATVGGVPILVTPPRYADPQIEYHGQDIETANPYCMAAVEDVDAIGIVSGETGSIITIVGRDYRVLSIELERSGMAMLELGAT